MMSENFEHFLALPDKNRKDVFEASAKRLRIRDSRDCESIPTSVEGDDGLEKLACDIALEVVFS